MLLLAVCIERVGGSKNLISKTCIGGFLNWVSLYYDGGAMERVGGSKNVNWFPYIIIFNKLYFFFHPLSLIIVFLR